MTGTPGLPVEVLVAFRARMRQDGERLASLGAALAEESAQPLAEDPRRDELDRIAHGLVGAGATFGFAEVTAAAEDVERLSGLHPALLAAADAECRRLLLIAVERLCFALTSECEPTVLACPGDRSTVERTT